MVTLPDNGWFIGGGAQHSAAMMRVMAGIATGGRPGVIQSGDLAVTATTPASLNVNVAPGGVVIDGPGPYEAYVNRLQSTQVVSIDPAGIAARSDMVVIGVQDPIAGGRPLAAGESMAERLAWEINVIKGVPATARDAAALPAWLRPRYPFLPLARIDVPPSAQSQVILSGHIVPLTTLSPVRSLTITRAVKTTIQADTPAAGAGMQRWPNVTQKITIPDWASTMTASVTLINVSKVINTAPYNGALYLYQIVDGVQGELEIASIHAPDTSGGNHSWVGHSEIVTAPRDVRHMRNKEVTFETRVVTPTGVTSSMRAPIGSTVSKFEFNFES